MSARAAAAAVGPPPSLRLGVAPRRATLAGSLLALTKPRLAFLSVLTTCAGYGAALPEFDPLVFLWMVLGTAFSAGGALGLNQWLERDADARMVRTRDRPLPSGDVSPTLAWVFSSLLAAAGIALLAWGVNLAAAGWSLATVLSYNFAYTPLKYRSRWSTEVGAVSGALPPLIGWAAGGGSGPLGLILFLVLLFWQMPHFLAVGWVHREDYRRAGMPLLPATDASGARTAWWSLAHTVALLAVSAAPVALGIAGAPYGVVAALLGAGFLALAVRFLAAGDRLAPARRLFLASLAYLPLLLGALLIDLALP